MPPRSGGHAVALIVNTFQKPRHLALVLASIAAQTDVAGRFAVIVTDDGSTDDTPRLVHDFAARHDFPVRFTSRPHDGFRLARTRNAHQPRLPGAMDRRYADSLFGFSSRRRYYYRGYGRSEIPQPRQSTGCMERALFAGTDVASLAAGSYLAVVERSPEVVLGVASAREESSLHVILGRF